MKTIFASLFLFMALSVIGQQAGPQIQVDKNTHNFGMIKEEAGPVSYNFEIRNTGNSPLIISNVSSSCGCTASDWPKEPLAPGANTTIKATYNPKGRPGTFNQSITVYTNAAPTGTVLTLRGQVEPKPKTPDEIYRRRIGDLGMSNSHLSVGKVSNKDKVSSSLDIYNFGEEPVTVSFERVPSHISITTKPKTLKPNEAGTIDVTFDASSVDDWGFVISRISVLVNEKQTQGNLISISGNIEEDFSKLSEKELATAAQVSFAQTQMEFGSIDEGTLVKHDFEFTNTGKSDLIIRKISASCGCTTVAPSMTIIKPGEKSAISASFRTNGYSGRQSKTITVITNDPKQSTMLLRLTGTVNKK
ncbi:MAG: DUF1573 domain-containing protein [Bacteroidales bacterium]|nr:DUF1573 domain-containing protein [Bacteroidales bacterium]MDY0197313.1 DUF1573 domain-containing protein [Tenuifilaceae bacterium]